MHINKCHNCGENMITVGYTKATSEEILEHCVCPFCCSQWEIKYSYIKTNNKGTEYPDRCSDCEHFIKKKKTKCRLTKKTITPDDPVNPHRCPLCLAGMKLFTKAVDKSMENGLIDIAPTSSIGLFPAYSLEDYFYWFYDGVYYWAEAILSSRWKSGNLVDFWKAWIKVNRG
jgi:hypothetical protein